VLFVAPRFPEPPLQGDRLRAYELLRQLHQRHTITLVAPDQAGAAQHAAKLCSDWQPVAPSRISALAQLVAALPSSDPLQVAYLCPPALRAKVRDLLHTNNYDILHLHTARVAPVAAGARIPVVVDLIDALSLNMRRRAEREHGLARILFAYESQRMARYEQHLLNTTAGTVLVSAADQAALGNHPRIRIVPMGVDSVRFRYCETEREAATIIFSGRMAYFPNADAAQFLAREIFPLVRTHIPHAQLRIVGADPPAAVQALEQLAGVHVTGYVADLAGELQRATVAAAPLRAGTGMQIKVLEAMACGLPVVATRQVLAGVAAHHGQHALAGETAAQLAAAIIRLIEQPLLRHQLARAAHHLVEELYTWERAADAFDQLYHSIARMPANAMLAEIAPECYGISPGKT
jgi:sugar transferase (PEP-CTERM/EpsH1 system associated)